MQFIIKNLRRSLILLLPFAGFSQTTYLPQGTKHAQLLERLTIRLATNRDLNLSTVKPFSRKDAVAIVESTDTSFLTTLSVGDRYNIKSLLMNSSEWVKGDKNSFSNSKSIWNTF